MDNAEYPYFVVYNLEDYPIISNAKLPVSVKCFPQGNSILLRFRHKTRFNCFFDASFHFRVKERNIGRLDLWMISQIEGHSYQTSVCFKDFPFVKVLSLLDANVARAISSSISIASFTRSRTLSDRETPSRDANRSIVLYSGLSNTTLILGFFTGIF